MEYEKISVDDLKKLYVKPDPPGVVSASNACFESDLETLNHEGRISINDNMIKYIK